MLPKEHNPIIPDRFIQSYERRDFFAGPKTYTDEQFLTMIDRASELDSAHAPLIVADVMSGPGGVGLALHKKHPEHLYCFIDLATGQFNKIAGENLKGLKIFGDARRLPATDNVFDVAVARYGIKNLQKKEQPTAIHELFRTLKPGGILVIADMMAPNSQVKGWLNAQHAKKQMLSGRSQYEGVCHIPTETEWIRFLQDEGFETTVEGYYTSHVNTTDWVKGKQVNHQQLEELDAMILNAPFEVQKAFNIYSDADGVHIDYPVIIIKAKKPLVNL